MCDWLNENGLNKSSLIIQKGKKKISVQNYIGIIERHLLKYYT